MLNLVASAVPGLRDLRAPLVVGYLWLLIVWLAVQPSTPLADVTARGITASVIDLADLVGPAATAVSVSIVAYVIGTISVSLPGIIGPAVGASLSERVGLFSLEYAPSDLKVKCGSDVGVVLGRPKWRKRLARRLSAFNPLRRTRIRGFGIELSEDWSALGDRSPRQLLLDLEALASPGGPRLLAEDGEELTEGEAGERAVARSYASA